MNYVLPKGSHEGKNTHCIFFVNLTHPTKVSCSDSMLRDFDFM